MVAFGGWHMPVQYEGIIKEHHAVRSDAGLFDISHMGNFIVSGPQSGDFLDSVLTNHVGKLEIGEGQYNLMLNEEGGVIDDLILYCIDINTYYLVVNAAKISEDLDWLQTHLERYDATVTDVSSSTGAVALQGPRSEEIIRRLFGGNEIPTRNHIAFWKFEGQDLAIARTGYTGEDGFECFVPSSHITSLWNLILQKSRDLGCKPCGLGARDTLRLEAGLPLNGNDLSPSISPIEAGLKIFVNIQKEHNFPGRPIIENQIKLGPTRKLVAFSVTAKGAPPRPHYEIFIKKDRVGEITSGGVSPTLEKGIGLALIEAKEAVIGREIFIEIRGKKVPAKIEKKPLYRRN